MLALPVLVCGKSHSLLFCLCRQGWRPADQPCPSGSNAARYEPAAASTNGRSNGIISAAARTGKKAGLCQKLDARCRLVPYPRLVSPVFALSALRAPESFEVSLCRRTLRIPTEANDKPCLKFVVGRFVIRLYHPPMLR